jgi:hypothetical protein
LAALASAPSLERLRVDIDEVPSGMSAQSFRMRLSAAMKALAAEARNLGEISLNTPDALDQSSLDALRKELQSCRPTRLE